jgi:alcohol dehydrogenase (quinone), cytochrome c subunit
LKVISKAVLLCGMTLLCAGGIFACVVLASGHKSTLRDPGRSTSQGNDDEYLARATDCVACHSIPGGKAFAGGLKMGTPLGAIYSTNITPDPETGIGKYTLADFDLAVRYGIAKDGRHLYPAMPYPSYVKLADADVAALYRFFMKQVPAVHQANMKSEIPALLSFRWPLAFWNFFFGPVAGYIAKL